MIRLIPTERALELFPKNPVTQKPALDMDPAEIKMPLHIGQTFTFEGQTLKITALGEQQSPDGDEYILVGVDLA